MEIRLFIFLLLFVLRVCGKQCQLANVLAPHVVLDQTCQRNLNETCSYTCDLGYRPTNTPSSVTCTASSTWDKPLFSLCEKIVCPSNIPNGYLLQTCQGEGINEYCFNYGCNAEYYKSRDTILKCNASGQWEWLSPSDLDFCMAEEDLCPSDIKDGRLSHICNRVEGSTCSYNCKSGSCRNVSASYWLTCQNRTWDADTDSLCANCSAEKDLCPSEIKGGWLSNNCNRVEGSMCSYYCHYGCRNLSANYWLTCQNRTWDADTDSLCTKCYEKQTTSESFIKCPHNIPNGHVSDSCDLKLFSVCDVHCNEGCNSVWDTLSCYRTGDHGYWDAGQFACACHDSGSKRHRAVVIGGAVTGFVCGVILFILMICKCVLRTAKPATQSVSSTMPSDSRNASEQTVATTNTSTDNQAMELDDSSSRSNHLMDNGVSLTQIRLQGLSEYNYPPNLKTTPPSYEEVTSNTKPFRVNESSTNI